MFFGVRAPSDDAGYTNVSEELTINFRAGCNSPLAVKSASEEQIR